jgi:integrase
MISGGCMAIQWKSVPNSPGIQYFKEKKHGRLKLDTYYRCHFQLAGKKHFVGLGWESSGMTLDKAIQKRKEYFDNTKAGVKPRNPKEEIELAQEQARKEEEEAKIRERDKMTFSTFWEKYYLNNNNKKSWRQEKSFYKNWIEPNIGHLELKEIKRMDLEEIKNQMEKKGSTPRNIQYCLAVVRQVFNRAIDLELYDKANPVKKSLMPSGAAKSRKRILTKEEEKILFPELKKRSQLSHDLALMSLYTGMRFSEIARMKWDDISWEENKVIIHNAKDPNNKDKVRYAYFPDFIKRMLKERQEDSSCVLCFPGKDNVMMKSVPKCFERAVRCLKLNEGKDHLNRLVFYSLRHSYASRLVDMGVHQLHTQNMMGHDNISMTSKYYHGQDKTFTDIAKLFDHKAGKILPMAQNQ